METGGIEGVRGTEEDGTPSLGAVPENDRLPAGPAWLGLELFVPPEVFKTGTFLGRTMGCALVDGVRGPLEVVGEDRADEPGPVGE